MFDLEPAPPVAGQPSATAMQTMSFMVATVERVQLSLYQCEQRAASGDTTPC